jgi:hypothetical protein
MKVSTRSRNVRWILNIAVIPQRGHLIPLLPLRPIPALQMPSIEFQHSTFPRLNIVMMPARSGLRKIPMLGSLRLEILLFRDDPESGIHAALRRTEIMRRCPNRYSVVKEPCTALL